MNQLPNNFNWSLARKLAIHAAHAYSSVDITDSATDAGANVILDDDGSIIVSFRGSCHPRDFVQDAKFAMSELLILDGRQDVFVHEGFNEDFKAIYLAVISNVKTLLAVHPEAKIYLTGHSLGASLATLCAFSFWQKNLPVAGVITFGCPRTGNSAFREIYNAALGDRSFRIVNQNDIVPRTPGVLMGYRHCGQEIFLPPNLGPSFNPSLWFKVLCDCVGLYAAYRNLEDVLIRDHLIAAYQERIKNL
jgi:hypothetical protein